MTDLIKREDALAAIDMALNNATGDLFDCHAAIRALPAVASATLTPNPVADSQPANPVVNDSAAIRALQTRIEELVAELDLMKTAGIIEIASRNNRVTEYMFHWEGRALDAEAKLVTAVEALREIEVDCDADYPASHGAIKHDVRIVLAELEGE